jgi:long-subunit fatty acid transport protein
MYLTTTVGATIEMSKSISFATAIRYISAQNKTNAGMTLTSSPFDLDDMPLILESEDKASGMGFVISLNVNATEKLNFTSRYESQVNLDFKTKQITDDFGATVDGEMNRRDLPAVLAFGAGYSFNEKIRAFADYNYYFQSKADWGKSTAITKDQPWSKLAGDASTIAAGIQYKISPMFTTSIGGGYTNYDWNDRDGYYTKLGTFEVMQDDNYNLNTGFSLKATKALTVNVGYMHTFWAKDQTIKALNADPLDVDVTIHNSMDAFAFGIDIAF